MDPKVIKALTAMRDEIEAWRNGKNHRNMNKCKVGAVFASLHEIDELFQTLDLTSAMPSTTSLQRHSADLD